MPYLIRSANTFGDFDGDGRYEVASFCLANNSLNILSNWRFWRSSHPGTLNFGIAQCTGQRLQLVWFSTGSSAPDCGLNASDQFFVADVNGDGTGELTPFTQDGQSLFVLQYQPRSTSGEGAVLNYNLFVSCRNWAVLDDVEHRSIRSRSSGQRRVGSTRGHRSELGIFLCADFRRRFVYRRSIAT
jgi:hypothetical protein